MHWLWKAIIFFTVAMLGAMSQSLPEAGSSPVRPLPSQKLRPSVQQRTPPVVTSASGQFIIHSAGQTFRNNTSPNIKDIRQDRVQLTPQFLSVSCERIKTAVLRILGMSDQWKGRVRVTLFPTFSGNENARITCTFYSDGPHYDIAFPKLVHPEILIKGMVQVLLQEIANRNPGVRSAEIPFWLVEGLTRHLMLSDELTLILQPPSKGVLIQSNPRIMAQPEVNLEKIIVRQNPVSEAVFIIKNKEPISFTELSLLTAADLNADGLLLYQACSQVFLHGLMALPGGQAALRDFLQRLPQHWNWHTAFFTAYRSYFVTALDVERWWAVTVTSILNSNQYQAWSEMETMRKLDEVLQVPVRITEGENGATRQDTLSLRSVLADWEPEQAVSILQIKIQQLTALELNSSRKVAPFVAAYRGLCEDLYDKLRAALGWEASKGKLKPRLNYFTEKGLERFDNLENQRLTYKERIDFQALSDPENPKNGDQPADFSDRLQGRVP